MSVITKVVITAFGDESKLAVVQADLPDPPRGQVQLAVQYSVVAGSDVNMRRGVYPFQRKAPLTPGYSVVGTVLTNGPGATRLRPGTRVAALTKYDGQATRINLPERFLVPVPDAVDGKPAVALVLDWLTAFQMLHRTARVQPGQTIFVHGLSGGVGGALLRLARLHGVTVLGTASPAKHDVLRAAGAIPFDYHTKDWIADVQQRGGVHAVFDPLGFQSFDESWTILSRGGILVGYGMNLQPLSDGPRRPVLPVLLKLFARNLQLWTRKRATFFGLNRGSKHYRPDLEHLFAFLQQGKLDVPIKAVFPLAEIQAAHRAYASDPGIGSIILEIQP